MLRLLGNAGSWMFAQRRWFFFRAEMIILGERFNEVSA